MGMDLKSVIAASTWAPAQAIHREKLGNLSIGSPADIAILRLVDGKFQLNDTGTFGFWDYTGTKIQGKQKLEAEVTIRAGRVVYDLNGLTNPLVVPRR
jgi:dihydroorotase